MNVLWFVNIPFPPVSARLGRAVAGSGWWLIDLAARIAQDRAVRLTVAHCSHRYGRFEAFEQEGITYWMIPAKQAEYEGWRSGRLARRLADLVNHSDAEIVDVHGTERPYGLISSFVRQPVVITIQGLMTALAAGMGGGKSLARVLFLQTRRAGDVKWAVAEIHKKVRTLARCPIERRIFRENRWFIGRTDWDHLTARRLSPNLRGYYSCPRILRRPFYDTAWLGPESGEQRVFTSARCEPYKGLDDLIRCLHQLKTTFPELSVRIAGDCYPYGWGGYLRRLAGELEVDERVHFLGYLNAQQIAEELRRTSVYVHPSYVDNSPNSLAEAMCVGVPCVGSTTGGIPSMIRDGETGLLFQTGSVAELSEKVSAILGDADLAARLARQARAVARERHDPDRVARTTLDIYQKVLEAGRQ